MSRPAVLFLRGFVASGTDRIRIGPFDRGLYYERLLPGFDDVDIFPVLGLGRGSAEIMGENAYQSILKHPLFRCGRRFHLLGHSMGGMIARYLAHKSDIASRLISVTSVGCPHLGTEAAVSNSKEVTHFESVRPDLALLFNKTWKDVGGVPYFSILGSKKWSELPILFKLADLRFNRKRLPADGLVTVESQRWGKELGHFDLDHLEQIGLSMHWSRKRRLTFEKEFKTYQECLRSHWYSFKA